MRPRVVNSEIPTMVNIGIIFKIEHIVKHDKAKYE